MARLAMLDEVPRPALRPGQTVLMDNPDVPKAVAVRERLKAGGCRLVFLPRYRPLAPPPKTTPRFLPVSDSGPDRVAERFKLKTTAEAHRHFTESDQEPGIPDSSGSEANYHIASRS